MARTTSSEPDHGVLSLGVADRAREIAAFLGDAEDDAVSRLAAGFPILHQAVADDFRRFDPATDERLLEWYRTTTAYVWELSAYHMDPTIDWAARCRRIVACLTDARVSRPLVLGDGIGDLTLVLIEHGFDPTYHDLAGSRTAAFAASRFRARLGRLPEIRLSQGWAAPPLHPGEFDAVLALDFFEHMTDVEAWAAAVVNAMRGGGLLYAFNAFGLGSPDRDGSIPAHLVRNTRFEQDWDPLMTSLGLVSLGDLWWRKP
jgi:SAM-dependent methyltransferase